MTGLVKRISSSAHIRGRQLRSEDGSLIFFVDPILSSGVAIPDGDGKKAIRCSMHVPGRCRHKMWAIRAPEPLGRGRANGR